MPSFHYSGINRYGERLRGVIEGKNIADAENKLKSSRVDILSIKQKSAGLTLFRSKKITRKEIITITFQFEQLMRAGVPLMEILVDLRDSFDNHATKEMLSSIYQSMEGGEGFGTALEGYKSVFGEVYISLVKVGEQTGQLESVLADLGEMLKWEDEMIAKAKKVMIYPAIVGTVVIAVVVLMMLFVVPQLLSFIGEMGGEIGWATKSLIATSNFVQAYILHLLIMPFILFAVLKAWLKRSVAFRMAFDRFIFKVKVIGPILYQLKIARLSSALAIMYKSGVSFTDAMKMAASVVGNAHIEASINTAVRLVQEGEPIHKAFEQASVFPTLGVRMLKVGERSGKMDEALLNVSYFYDREAKESIEKIEPAIEPLLTIVMAVIVGWVMIAVLGPVYDTMTQVDF
ncbi:type II secretion system F family protein [Thiomicrospira microaerophila]|uniref:type II secretion system F family protein n=1 Tax=Thiomicrospira microaerophila TaxID=406020 RepID=UPI0005C8FE04|nr:type II secretion system F family protein [Thiomicrospira microaerophila]